MKKYDKHFKEEAERLSADIGVRKAAEQLGVSYHTLSDWRSRKRERGGDAFIGSGHAYSAMDGMTAREAALQREIDELKRVNDILKDALYFFAKDRKK